MTTFNALKAVADRVAAGFNPLSFDKLEAYPHAPLFSVTTAGTGESKEIHKVGIYCSAGVMTIDKESTCSDPGIGVSDHYCQDTTRLIVKRDDRMSRIVRYISGPDVKVDPSQYGATLVFGARGQSYYDAVIPMESSLSASVLFDVACVFEG